MRIVEQYLAQLNIEKRRWRRAAAILTVLSLQRLLGLWIMSLPQEMLEDTSG